MNVELWLLGEQIDMSLLGERLPAYLLTLLFVAVLGSGFEEPGWRGFALPRLQVRYTLVRHPAARVLLGTVAPTPVRAAFVGPMFYAFFYTYLYNKTGSVGLCILLHGDFTAALDKLILTTDSLTVDLTILATLVIATVVLVVATRGRLGYHPTGAAVSSETSEPGPEPLAKKRGSR